MNPICANLPYVIFGSNPDTSERYAVFTEEGTLSYTNRLSDAYRFSTARSAYEFAAQRNPGSPALRYKVLQDYRVGRRVF
jgi:hypothetical protein